MSLTLLPDLPLHRVAGSLGVRVAARFRRIETQGARLRSGRLDVRSDRVIVRTRSPKGVILLACGADCSALLVADHVGAGLAMGNRVVIAFVEPPSGALSALVATLSRCLPTSMFQAVRGHGEKWGISPRDDLVVAVLTSVRVTVGDRHYEHVTPPTITSTETLLGVYSDDRAIVVPVMTATYVDATA